MASRDPSALDKTWFRRCAEYRIPAAVQPFFCLSDGLAHFSSVLMASSCACNSADIIMPHAPPYCSNFLPNMSANSVCMRARCFHCMPAPPSLPGAGTPRQMRPHKKKRKHGHTSRVALKKQKEWDVIIGDYKDSVSAVLNNALDGEETANFEFVLQARSQSNATSSIPYITPPPPPIWLHPCLHSCQCIPCTPAPSARLRTLCPCAPAPLHPI